MNCTLSKTALFCGLVGVTLMAISSKKLFANPKKSFRLPGVVGAAAEKLSTGFPCRYEVKRVSPEPVTRANAASDTGAVKYIPDYP